MTSRSNCFTPSPVGVASDRLWLSNPAVYPEREPLRHIVLGSPAGVRQTIHRLHVVQYVEQIHWSPLIVVPPSGIVITPEQGEVMTYLVRYRQA